MNSGDQARTARLNAVVLAPRELDAGQQSLWRQWCAGQKSCRLAFLTLDFVLAVDAVRPDVRVAILSRDGQPVAFLPFQYATPLHRMLGWAERVGAAMSDYFGLVAAPGFHTTSSELLRACGLSIFPYDHLDDTQMEFGLDRDTRLQKGLLIRFEQGPEAYWQDLTLKDKDFVQDTLRRQRQLADRVGPLRCEHISGPNEAALSHLIEAKRRQYQATGVADALSEAWKPRLLHQLQHSVSDQCSPFISTLHAGDTWVASHFGLRFQERLHYWFPVYNPELKRYAPGRLLLKATIDAALTHGISIIDRGAGESQAKLDFANDSHLFHAGLWRRPTPRAAVARAALSLSWRLQSPRGTQSADR